MMTDQETPDDSEDTAELSQEKDWRSSIEDPELHKVASRYETVDAMAKAVADLRRETSVRIKPLGPDPSVEELAAYRRQIGVPETADEYEFQLANSAEPSIEDAAFRETMARAMHDANVTAAQAAALNQAFNDHLSQQDSAAAELETAMLEANVTALQQEFGLDYDRNLELARRAARTFGNESFVDFLESKTVDGVPLGGHPAFVRAFAQIGRATNEPPFDSGSVHGDRSTLEESIREKRAEIQQALERGDHKQAQRLDREERALWQRMEE